MAQSDNTQTRQSVSITETLMPIETDAFRLTSIVTLPNTVNEQAPLVLVPNSGLVHHVGTCRSVVNLARFLGANGVITCRVDLPNLGDSGPRFGTGAQNDDERTKEELKATIDQLQKRYGPKSILVYGLCSGSQNGFKLAIEDTRVIGLFGVDHFGYKNWSYALVHYSRRILSLDAWIYQIKKRLKISKTSNASVVNFGADNFTWQYPPKFQVEDGYRALVSRGVKMEYVYTGDWAGEYNHQRQFFLMHKDVDFKGLAKIHYMPNMSHILAEPESQVFVKNQVLAFVKRLSKRS